MIRKTVLFILLLSFISINAFAEDKMRVAVMDLKAENVSGSVATAVSNMIRSDFVDSGLFAVVERNQMSEIMKEQELQMTGCTDNACAVELGKLLSARKILIGDITKVGKTFIITIRIVDVEKGVAEFSSKESAASDAELDKAASKLTVKLIGRITGKTQSDLLAGLDKRTMSGYWARCVVPGWGQFYADKKIEGFIFSGLFAASLAFTGYSFYDYYAKDKEYSDLQRGSAEFDSKADAMEKAATLYNYSWIAVGAAYVLHWIDAGLLARPDFGSKDNALLNGGSYFEVVTDRSSTGIRERYVGVEMGLRF